MPAFHQGGRGVFEWLLPPPSYVNYSRVSYFDWKRTFSFEASPAIAILLARVAAMNFLERSLINLGQRSMALESSCFLPTLPALPSSIGSVIFLRQILNMDSFPPPFVRPEDLPVVLFFFTGLGCRVSIPMCSAKRLPRCLLTPFFFSNYLPLSPLLCRSTLDTFSNDGWHPPLDCNPIAPVYISPYSAIPESPLLAAARPCPLPGGNDALDFSFCSAHRRLRFPFLTNFFFSPPCFFLHEHACGFCVFPPSLGVPPSLFSLDPPTCAAFLSSLRRALPLSQVSLSALPFFFYAFSERMFCYSLIL